MANNVPFLRDDVFSAIYGESRLDRIRSEAELLPERVTSENLELLLPQLADVEVIFSCWGMLKLTTAQLEQLPNLKAVFYASGSVADFAGPFADRGVLISNGIEANAIPVAEFCLGQILLSCKGTWRNNQACRSGPWKQADMPIGPGIYGDKVALLGIGAISRHLLKLLQPFHLHVLAVSNYLNAEAAQELGIDALADIETCFREAIVISNHLVDRPSNQGILHEEHFASMREGATFINTGRGAQVDEVGLIKVLKARPDLTALLDVQHPEPPEAGSELYALPNVHLTSHIAGSMNDELGRMADFIIDDFLAWKANRPMQHTVDLESLALRA